MLRFIVVIPMDNSRPCHAPFDCTHFIQGITLNSERTPGITRGRLEEMWQAEVDELERTGTPVEAPAAAISSAILIR